MKDLGYLAQDISILHRQYYKDTGSQFEKLDLNPTAACILLTINDHQNINQSQIARELVLDKGMVARQIKKLVDNGWVTKQPRPGKSLEVSLTDTGEQVLNQAQLIRRKWWEDRFAQTGIKADSPIIPSIEKVVQTIIGDTKS
ncbi:MarR family winged helix-turn-helix transcriptional regulator [Lactobacillus sp. Sy-1]|uniref:MarR family winged helix-turn-helix transcriptional regulator n=1 Tax=Lactobacillus sp. Sy-1 TaxID=2109645 RepID=UPI001C5B6BA7|nr:MarR family transcriptional regulator [Lactobacillus sp. Sy-1]MBW1606109.1 MarR family transcriptional regulator [Lactobacillus sp. Sy-1]